MLVVVVVVVVVVTVDRQVVVVAQKVSALSAVRTSDRFVIRAKEGLLLSLSEFSVAAVALFVVY